MEINRNNTLEEPLNEQPTLFFILQLTTPTYGIVKFQIVEST